MTSWRSRPSRYTYYCSGRRRVTTPKKKENVTRRTINAQRLCILAYGITRVHDYYTSSVYIIYSVYYIRVSVCYLRKYIIHRCIVCVYVCIIYHEAT